MSDARSGLFHAAVAVIKALKPRYVFLENVHKIMTVNQGEDFAVILRTMEAAGYECRWTTCTGRDVCVPQVRKRWFCLCVKKGSRDVEGAHLFDAGCAPVRKMPKLVANRSTDLAARFHLLGNAIIPAVARFAFKRLCTKFGELSTPSSKPTLHGFSANGKVHYVTFPAGRTFEYEIVLDPRHYTPDYIKRKLVHRSPPVLQEMIMVNWPTPRSNAPRHSNSLSDRNTRDLATTALFACKVQGVRQPKPTQGMSVNIEFVEWLMGYPRGWTAVS